ncbi:30S ribosomal protein S8e [Candidatus Woesearchaeota archaeon]|nr:30S ribosomal protein S8e [Candidatus Woesearchaeota archaeon]
MVINQRRSKKKPSGARYISGRKKRQFESGNNPTLPKIDAVKKRTDRVIGGNSKTRFLSADVANVYDPKTKKYSKMKILSVVKNPANRHYVRRNVLTKGTVFSTDKGEAKVTSRPGQEGTVNAVFIIEEKK